MNFLFNPERDVLEETEKAVAFRIVHNSMVKKMWIPKSIINQGNPPSWRRVGIVEIPDWLWNRKIEELF